MTAQSCSIGDSGRSSVPPVEPPSWNSDIHSAGLEGHVLGNKAERPYLTVCTDRHPDIDDAPDAHRDARPEPDGCRFDDTPFNRVSGNVRVGANDHVVAEFEQVVVTHRKAVDINTSSDPRATEPQIEAPGRVPRNNCPVSTRTT